MKGLQPCTNYWKDIGNMDRILDCWAEEDKPEDEEEVVFQGPEMEIEKPMYAEVERSVDTLKKNKAPGEDRIQAMLLLYEK